MSTAAMINLQEMLRRVWGGEHKGTATYVLSCFLCVLSLPYQLVVGIRNMLYDKGLLRSQKLTCPVISIGNLTVGGTGKTPLTILLARMLKGKGFKPVILSRGYGRQGRQNIAIVSDGRGTVLDHHESGDEPFLMSQLLPHIPVVVGASRFLTGKKAIDELGADILILDDGFQHRSLYRDIDIVLLENRLPFGNGCLLPGGSLREPPGSLRRAGIIVMTGSGERADVRLPARLLTVVNSSSHCFQSRHEPRAVIAAHRKALPLAFLQGKKIYAFSGIGNPLSFRRTIDGLGANLCGFEAFPDHHYYDPDEITSISAHAQQLKADIILTTEKDGIRLLDFPDFLATIFLLRIEMSFIAEGYSFLQLILDTVKTGHTEIT